MPSILLCGYRHGGAQLKARTDRAAEVFHDAPHPKRIYYFSTDLNEDGEWRGCAVRERLEQLGLLPRHVHMVSVASNTREEVCHFLRVAAEPELVGVTSTYHVPRLWRIFQGHGRSAQVYGTVEGTRARDYIREFAAWGKLGLTSGLAH